jgi:hypothetical protein
MSDVTVQITIGKRTLAGLAVAAVAVPLALSAAAIPDTYGALTTFSNGTVADATEVNGNFATLTAAVNGNETAAVTNAADIGLALADLAALQGDVAANTTDIATNSGDIPDYDSLRWLVHHGAAAAACAALSPVGLSPVSRGVWPHEQGVTCATTCATRGGTLNQCLTSVAVGGLRTTQATAYTNRVASYYNYGCNDSQSAYDEVQGQGLNSSYTAYCCCYR